MKKYKKKLIFILIILMVIVSIASGCVRPFVIPGAQNKILIWQVDKNLFKVYFSSNNSAARAAEGHLITGVILTDGLFELTGFNLNESDLIDINKSRINLEIFLDEENFYKGLDIEITGYTYLEFDIKFDGMYRRDLLSLGTNLNYPENNVFRFDADYLLDLQNSPFYKKRPISSLIDKFFSDKIFAAFYLVIISLIIAGIITSTIKIRKSRNR